MIDLRILFFSYYPNPLPSAGWTRISFFGQYLSSKGHEVSIGGVFSPKTLGQAGCKKWNGLRLINIIPIIMTHNFLSLIFNIVSSIFPSIILMIWLRPQVVIISVPHGEVAFGSFLISRMFRKYTVADYRDLWEDYKINLIKSQFYKKLYRIFKTLMATCYRYSDQVITVTEPFVFDLKSKGVKDVRIVTNGADIKIFKPYDKIAMRKKLGVGDDDFILTYSGMVQSDHYRLDIVLKALKKLLDKVPNTKLLLFGYGNEITSLIELSRQLDLDKKLSFFGFQIR